MKRLVCHCRRFVAVLAMVAGATAFAEEPNAKSLEFFEAKIRPVLIKHCYECHSGEAAARGKLKGGLALDTRAAVAKGGESGPAVVAKNPAESLLLKAIRHEPDVSEMPPNEKLSAEVIADFETWIQMGAPDPRDGAAVEVKKGMSLEDGRKFWSFVPPRASDPPSVKNDAWPRGDVDRFVLAKLEAEELSPLRDAPPAILLRRLHLDLLGLPPGPEEVAAFVERYQAADDDAREALLAETVDRLLASPHFGERWARHWLDVARYADSNGRDRNVYFFHAWRYRDYVIQAFNDDKPYDRFVREQLAGDLLPFDSPSQRDEQRVATGFLALGSKAFEETKPEIFRMDVVDDQIEVVGRAFLGLSVGCARCHDHKFDPLPTADYYALAGIFRSTQPLYGYGPKGIKAMEHANSELLTVGPNAAAEAKEGGDFLSKMHALQLHHNTTASDRYRVIRQLSAVELQLKSPDADRPKLEAEIVELKARIAEWDVKWADAKAAVQTAMDSGPRNIPWAMGVRERAAMGDCRIHVRGETTNLGPTVPRGMLQVIPLADAAAISPGESGRSQLAEWLTRRDHPLTARVFVNRVWLHLFGRGLVTTPDDYGVNGARPSHPELLDTLAVRLMESGWSTKRLIRTLVLSRTYRTASKAAVEEAGVFAAQDEKDPENITLWRTRPRRLEAEILRDAILAVSGDLQRSPPRPEEQFLSQLNPYREDEYRTFNPVFQPNDLEHRRRGVYTPVIRGVLPEVFQLFDFASPERSVPQRDESIVPAQALFFMNHPWVIEQARQTAKKLLADSDGDDAGRIARLYELAYARTPTSEEIARATTYLNAAETLKPDPQRKSPQTDEELRLERWTSFCQTVFGSAEFRYVR